MSRAAETCRKAASAVWDAETPPGFSSKPANHPLNLANDFVQCRGAFAKQIAE
jgi:hypothetical protein